MFFGTPGQGNSYALLSVVGDQSPTLTLFGFALAAGDSDGDGEPELWCGAPVKTTNLIDSGMVFQAKL